MNSEQAILVGRSGVGKRYAAALSLASYMHTAQLTAEEIAAIKIEALESGLPINEALEHTAEQMPFIQSEPVIITNPYKFEVLRPAKATQKPTQGGAYNCRKPKYKTKKRR